MAKASTDGIKQQQSERTRAILIQAATDLLLDKGYSGTDPSRRVFLRKMQTTQTLVLSGIRRSAMDGERA